MISAMRLPLSLFLFFTLCSTGLILSSCEKDPVVQQEILTVYDTVFISVTDTLFIPEIENVTSFILIRHADITPAPGDPFLNVEGLERADELVRVLSEIELDRVYSTDYNRTTQTALPTADAQGLTIINYYGFDHDIVIDDILENANEGKVLIVGHSNTTANFLNALTGTTDYPDLSEDSFDDMFIVSTKSKGHSEVLHIKYGE